MLCSAWVNCYIIAILCISVCKYFSRKGAKSRKASAGGYFTRNPRKAQNLAPQVIADFFQLIIQIFHAEKINFHAEKINFHAEKKNTMPWQ